MAPTVRSNKPPGWDEGVFSEAPPGWDEAGAPEPARTTSGFVGGDVPLMEHTPEESERTGRGLLETAGMVGGGVLYSPAGPGGVLVGESMGFGLGKQAGNLLYGGQSDPARDVAEGALYSVAPRAVGTALKGAARQVPRSVVDKLYRSAAKMETVLKPQAIRKALDAAYRTRTTVSTQGQQRLAASIEGHLGFIDDLLAKNQGKAISKQEVVSRIDELAAEFIDMPVAKEYLGALGKMRQQFILEKPDMIPVARAQSIKRKAWAELQAFFRKANRLNASRKTIVGEQFNLKVGSALREGLEREIPEIVSANKALGGELELQTAIDRAVGRISNKDIISIMDPLMVEAFQKETWGPGLKAMVVRRMLEWPRFKSYLAIEIANAAKRPLVKATPGAGAIIPAAVDLLNQRP